MEIPIATAESRAVVETEFLSPYPWGYPYPRQTWRPGVELATFGVEVQRSSHYATRSHSISDLCLVERERGGDLDAARPRQVAVEVELFLELRELLVGEVGAAEVRRGRSLRGGLARTCQGTADEAGQVRRVLRHVDARPTEVLAHRTCTTHRTTR